MNDLTNSATANPGPMLVLGGTGKTGRRIVQRLGELGVPTRVGARSADPAFDWNDRDTWARAVDGVEAVYISYAPDLAVPGATGSIRELVDLAVAKGVRRLVLLSGRGEEEAQLCERIVQDSGLAWTVVRASWFAQNFSGGEFLPMVLDGAVTLPAGDIPEPFVDADDIADVAVAALTENGHHGQVYELTGPRCLTLAEAVAEIAEAAGRKVEYIAIPHEAFTSEITKSGAPDDIAWLLDYLFSTVLDGRNALVCDGVQRALGREPTDFSEFARKAAASGVWDVDSSAQDTEA